MHSSEPEGSRSSAETTTGREVGAWLLLLYTVPAEPARKRAFIWRELKRLGAVYLRDGVCVLPERDETRAACQVVADRVVEFGGRAGVVEGARLPAEWAAEVVARSRADRAEEYGEIAREAERLLGHVAGESEHREFTFPELEELEADLSKLHRWAEQVRARDHFDADGAGRVEELLGRCGQALAGLLERTFRAEATP